MSLTSYRAAPPRDQGNQGNLRAGVAQEVSVNFMRPALEDFLALNRARRNYGPESRFKSVMAGKPIRMAGL
jgi:hypothetical protein